MKQNIYIVYDTVSEDTVVIGTATTDGAFIRQNRQYMEKFNPNWLTDFELYCVGEYKPVSKSLVPCDARLVAWNTYNVPEVPVENKIN